MRQILICLNLTGCFVVYALSIDLFENAVLFLLFGILPGREQPVPATEMLAVYAGAALLVLGYAMKTTLKSLVLAAVSIRLKHSQAS